MSWNANEEKLLCHIVLDDSLAPLLSSDAGPAFFRAFIVEDRKSGEVRLKFRFRYKSTPRSWFRIAAQNLRGTEAVEDFRAGIEFMLTEAARKLGRPFPEGAIKCYYPPDDMGDVGRTIIWLEMQDLVEIDHIEPHPAS
jgi:hypothetical protein